MVVHTLTQSILHQNQSKYHFDDQKDAFFLLTTILFKGLTHTTQEPNYAFIASMASRDLNNR